MAPSEAGAYTAPGAAPPPAVPVDSKYGFHSAPGANLLTMKQIKFHTTHNEKKVAVEIPNFCISVHGISGMGVSAGAVAGGPGGPTGGVAVGPGVVVVVV